MRCSLFRYSCSKIFVIALFLLKKFRYSIIPAQKFSLFHYSSQKNTHYSIIPRTNFCYSYSIIPLQPPIQTQYNNISFYSLQLVYHSNRKWRTCLNNLMQARELREFGRIRKFVSDRIYISAFEFSQKQNTKRPLSISFIKYYSQPNVV